MNIIVKFDQEGKGTTKNEERKNKQKNNNNNQEKNKTLLKKLGRGICSLLVYQCSMFNVLNVIFILLSNPK
jgi:hypothetical protein